jgi:hypothetical protein
MKKEIRLTTEVSQAAVSILLHCYKFTQMLHKGKIGRFFYARIPALEEVECHQCLKSTSWPQGSHNTVDNDLKFLYA